MRISNKTTESAECGFVIPNRLRRNYRKCSVSVGQRRPPQTFLAIAGGGPYVFHADGSKSPVGPRLGTGAPVPGSPLSRKQGEWAVPSRNPCRTSGSALRPHCGPHAPLLSAMNRPRFQRGPHGSLLHAAKIAAIAIESPAPERARRLSARFLMRRTGRNCAPPRPPQSGPLSRRPCCAVCFAHARQGSRPSENLRCPPAKC